MSFSVRKDRPSPPPQRIAFDNFEADLRSGELRKAGYRIRLQAQPFQVLALLLANPGEVVTRDEICRQLWPGDTFVDFEHGLAAAVNKVREALGDSADEPRYIETLPKRGYRFIGKILPQPPAVMPSPSPDATPATEPAKLEAVPATARVPQQELAPAAASLPREPQPGWNWRAVVAVGVIAVAATTAAMFAWMSRKPVVAPSQTDPATVITPFTTFPGIETTPSFSPDGSRIAFAWDGDSGNKTGHTKFDLYVKVIGSEKPLKLTDHPSDWIASTWSPDGTQIAFHRLDGDNTGIYVVPALGGPERKLIATHAPYDLAAPLSWSPDGKWIAYSDAAVPGTGDHNISALLNVETLEVKQIPHDPSCRHEGVATFSHDGKHIAMVCVHNKDSYDYVVMDAMGNGRRAFVSYKLWAYGGLWTADDQSLLVAVESPGGSEFQEVRVSDGQIHTLKLKPGAWYAMSNDGRSLAYSVFDQRQKILRRDLNNPNAPPVEMLASTMQQNNATYSPDGKHIAFDSLRSGEWNVWVADADGSNPVQLSRGISAGYPQWSPDSQSLAYHQEEEGGQVGVYIVNIADRTPHLLKTNLRRTSHPFWSPDGKWIYLVGFDGTGRQIYRCPVNGGAATSVAEIVVESNDLGRPKLSPDGTKLYFTADESQLKVLDLTNPAAKPEAVPGLPQLGDDSQLVVASDGIYFSKAGNSQSIFFRDAKTGKTREILRTAKSLSEGVLDFSRPALPALH